MMEHSSFGSMESLTTSTGIMMELSFAPSKSDGPGSMFDPLDALLTQDSTMLDPLDALLT